MRVIDADALKKQFCEDCGRMYDNPNCKEEECAIIDIVDMMPTIDVQPVKHGKWIDPDNIVKGIFDNFFTCSECGEKSCIFGNYCPNCGAKMDKKEDRYIKDIFMTR